MPRTKHKSGGQPGNQNARKHGFYSRVLTPEQQQVLALASRVRGLDGEIAVMRLKIVSIVNHSPHDQKLLLEAMASLRQLLRVQQSLRNSDRHQSKDLYKRFTSWLKEDLSRGESGDSSRSTGGGTGEFVASEVEGFIPTVVEGLVPGELGENESSVK
jgi:hypothetical protein